VCNRCKCHELHASLTMRCIQKFLEWQRSRSCSCLVARSKVCFEEEICNPGYHFTDIVSCFRNIKVVRAGLRHLGKKLRKKYFFKYILLVIPNLVHILWWIPHLHQWGMELVKGHGLNEHRFWLYTLLLSCLIHTFWQFCPFCKVFWPWCNGKPRDPQSWNLTPLTFRSFIKVEENFFRSHHMLCFTSIVKLSPIFGTYTNPNLS
jgi:hypothetical protein